MAYKALYRTYRPQNFEEVAGQKHIIQTLKNALATNKIAHAYLFCGPRGTGKTTMAKLFAKALNCEEGIGHQCDKCKNCLEIKEGSHPDVIEIDAASNNGVEQVRNLIDNVNYLPIHGRKKVYIIDEVHMMTDNAFNALLKTLEEPPEHVVFILATTEPHEILPTILSRCQRYDFTKVSDDDIFNRVSEILESENIKYEKEAVNAIISLADGGVRDALSILDQVLAYSSNELKASDVFSLFGLTTIQEKISFINAINDGDVASLLNKIGSYSEAGVDLKRLTADLLDILKDVLVYKKCDDATVLTSLNIAQANSLSQKISIENLNEMIMTFLKAQSDYKTVSNIKTMFEVITLRLSTMNDNKIEHKEMPVQKEEPIQNEEVKPVVTVSEPAKEEIVETNSQIEEKEETAPDWLFDDEEDEKEVVEEDKKETEKKIEVSFEGDKYKFDDEMIIKFMVTGDKESRLKLLERWDELGSYLNHPTLGDIVALAKDGRPFIVTKNVVILAYDFSKLAERVNIKTNQAEICSLLSKMIGREVFVYALSRTDAIRCSTLFNNLRQLSKLPKANTINITLEDLKQ